MSDLLMSLVGVLTLCLGMFAVLIPMYFMLRHRDKTVKLPIDREQLLRLPGFGLQEEIRDKQLNIFGYMTMAVVVVAIPLATYAVIDFLKSGNFPTYLAAVITVTVPYFALKTVKEFKGLTRLRLGHTAELATASELLGLQAKGYQIFHDIQADKFNIDHLAVGPNGVFAIETKGRHKRFADNKVNESGQKGHELYFCDGKLQFPSWAETEPLVQADRQAKWVSQWLTKSVGFEITAVPVLVFPGWYIRLKSRPPFPLMNHKQLASSLPRVGNMRLSQEQVNSICWQVAQRAIQGPRD